MCDALTTGNRVFLLKPGLLCSGCMTALHVSALQHCRCARNFSYCFDFFVGVSLVGMDSIC